MDDIDRAEALTTRDTMPLALRRSLREQERIDGRRAVRRGRARLLGGVLVYLIASGVPLLGKVGLIAIPFYMVPCLLFLAMGILPNTLRPRGALAEGRVARALRQKASFEGVVVPIEEVRSPDGDCVAFDLVVQRCQDCDCVTPCGTLGGAFVWEERSAGVFLVRGELEDLLIERAEVHFETTLKERATSRFIRLLAGERVIVQGDLVEVGDGAPAGLRGLLASHREARRLLRPAPDTPILVHRNEAPRRRLLPIAGTRAST